MLAACTFFGNSAVDGGGLYNPTTGPAAITTLTDTIVAGNVEPGGAPDDINGSDATDVTGPFNLIGPGGSGGIENGIGGNIVLTTLTGLGLAPLADNGGPTETSGLASGQPCYRRGRRLQDGSRPISEAHLLTHPRHRRLPEPVRLGDCCFPRHFYGHQNNRRRQHRDAAVGG